MTMGSSEPGRREALKESRRSSRSDSHTGVLQAPATCPSANSEPRRASRNGVPDWKACQASSLLISLMGLMAGVSDTGLAAGAGEGATFGEVVRLGLIGRSNLGSWTAGSKRPGSRGKIEGDAGRESGTADPVHPRRRAGEARTLESRAAATAIPASPRTRRKVELRAGFMVRST